MFNNNNNDNNTRWLCVCVFACVRVRARVFVCVCGVVLYQTLDRQLTFKKKKKKAIRNFKGIVIVYFLHYPIQTSIVLIVV